MRTYLRAAAAPALVLAGISCGGDLQTTPSTSPATSTSATPSVVSLVVSPDTIQLKIGDGVTLGASYVMSNGARVPATVQWRSGNDEIVSLNPANGYLAGVGPGQTVISAVSGSLIAFASVTVAGPSTVGSSDALIIESFSMIAFQYQSQPNQWYYAPEIRARAAPGHSAIVGTLKFSVPGLDDPIPAFACDATLSGTARELNGEVYGDWMMSVFGQGHQATGGDATATITFVDDAGVLATRVIHGPVVQGGLPSTYTGGQNGGACFHGYGS
jgi:hypothetical protein